MTLDESIGSRIRHLRIRNNMSQNQVANLLGVSQVAIAKYEKGAVALSSSTLLWYADYFGVSMDYLFGRSGKEGRILEDNVLAAIQEQAKSSMAKVFSDGSETWETIKANIREYINQVKGEENDD